MSGYNVFLNHLGHLAWAIRSGFALHVSGAFVANPIDILSFDIQSVARVLLGPSSASAKSSLIKIIVNAV